MKKGLLLIIMVIAATTAVFAQESFPDPLPDPNGVPIVESIVGLLGLGGAYAVKLWRKRKNQD